MIYLVSLLFLHCLVSYLFGVNKTRLCCGLFGGCFDRPIDKEILDKLITLGFINQSRGEDSCGYFNGETIHKGVNEQKRFVDLFIKEGVDLPVDGKNNVFIGHTRKATSAYRTAKEAHPFETEKLIVAHNGVIRNQYALSSKYDVSTKDVWVDSLTLALLLDKVSYKILEEYEGYAALLIHKKDEPNTLYIYHGASKESKDGKEIEERPLFMLRQPEGTYVSSMKEPLELIKNQLGYKTYLVGSTAQMESEYDIETVPHNTIVKLTNGYVKDASIKINRGECNVKYSRYEGYEGWNQNYYGGTGGSSFRNNRPTQSPFPFRDTLKEIKGTKFTVNSPEGEIVTDIAGIDIEYESLPLESGKSPDYLYYYKGRYWVTGKSMDDKLAEGVVCVDKTGKVIPIIGDKTDRTKCLYFYRGVLLHSQGVYNTILSILAAGKENPNEKYYKGLTDASCNFAYAISSCAKYPVTLHYNECVSYLNKDGRPFWWIGSDVASGEFEPLYSSRKYKFKNGKLIRITATNQKDKNIIFDSPDENSAKNFGETIKGLLAFKNGEIIDKKGKLTVSDVIINFKKVFATQDEAIEELGDVGLCALNLYAEELLESTLNVKDITEKMTEKLSLFTIDEAVKGHYTLEQIMDASTDLPRHILAAISIVEQEQSEENEGEPVYEQNDDDLETQGKIVNLHYDTGFKNLNPPDMEEQMEKDIYNLSKKDEEDEKATNMLDETVDMIGDLWRMGTDSQLLNYSDLAQEISKAIFIGVTNLHNSLREVAHKYKKTELLMKIKRQASEII